MDATSLRAPQNRGVSTASLGYWTRSRLCTANCELCQGQAPGTRRRGISCARYSYSQDGWCPSFEGILFVFSRFSFCGRRSCKDRGDCFVVWSSVDFVSMSFVLKLIEIWKNGLRSSIRVRFLWCLARWSNYETMKSTVGKFNSSMPSFTFLISIFFSFFLMCTQTTTVFRWWAKYKREH